MSTRSVLKQAVKQRGRLFKMKTQALNAS